MPDTPHAPADDALPAELAAALDRMDALLDPALDLLTAGPDSATAKGSRDDMRAIRDALAARASPSRADGWISVDGELPQPFQDVLVHPRPTDYCCEGQVNTQGKWTYTEYEQNFGVHQRDCRVTHWRSMPPAPGTTVTCGNCGGTGEYLGHAEDCYDDLCALNHDEHSCAGRVERCDCVAPGAATVPAAVDVGAAQAETAQAAPVVPEALHTFLNAAAGEGLVIGGVDAADLYIAIFPERYAQACATPGATHGN